MGRQSKKRKAQAVGNMPTSEFPVRHIAIILGIGLGLRVLYDIGLAGSPFFEYYILDSVVLHSWATDIMQGVVVERAFFRAPLYPYILAALYGVFGVSQWSAVVFQHLLGLLTAVTVYFFARRLFDARIAVWAGVITAAYPTLIYFEGEVMTTALEVFLYTLTAYRLYLAVERPNTRNLIVVGLVLGLAAITRPTILPLGVLFPILYLHRTGWGNVRAVAVKTAVVAVAVLLPILPVTLHNAMIGGEFSLISTQGGVNFYIGNSRTADGITVTAVGPNLRVGAYQDNIWTSSVDEAERRLGRKLSESEVSSYWFREGLKEMAADPIRAAGLFGKKLWYFFHGQEIFNNKSLYYAGEYSGLMKVLLWRAGLNFPSGLLFPFLFVGILFAWWERKRFAVPGSFLLGYAVIVAAFFVCARFRQPIVPLAVLGGHTADSRSYEPGVRKAPECSPDSSFS